MEFQPNVIIRASAGTGKTHRLSGRFLQILWQGAAIDRVLATTFTRKAAGEIFARIIRRLAVATVDADALTALQESLGMQVTTVDCHQKLAELSASLHRVRVSTLDAHFGELARSLAFELGLPADWEIVDEAELEVLHGRALEEMLRDEDPQFAKSIVHILGHGEAPRGISRMLLGSFREYYEFFREGRFDELENWLNGLVTAASLNAIERSMVMEDIRRVALPDDSRIEPQRQNAISLAEDQDWDGFLKLGIIEKIRSRDRYYGKEFAHDVYTAFDPLIAHARAKHLNSHAARALKVLDLFRAFDRQLDRLKRSTRRLTFSDLPKALLEYSADRRLEFRMNGRIQHLLLDEFQDTSASQWRVLAPLAREIVDGGNDQTSFFCVGDVKQAIYGWRGGTSDILNEMHQRLPGCSLETLDVNRRSAQPIVDVVNTVFQNLGEHNNLGSYEALIVQWSRDYPEHTTIRDQPGYVRFQTTHSSEDEAVYQRTADLVADHLIETPTLDVGILVRTNKRIPPIVAALKARGISASEEGGNPLDDTFAVRLIMALLRLVDHPGSTADAFLVAHSTLGSALGFAPNFTDTDRSVEVSPLRCAEKLGKQIRIQLERDGLGAVLTEWVRVLLPHVDELTRSRLWQLVDLAYEYEPRMRARCLPFVRFIAERKVNDPTSHNVRVMTVHQAKGLEFDCVVLCDLDDSKLAGSTDGLSFSRHPDDYAPYRFLHTISSRFLSLMPDEVQDLMRADLRWRLFDSLCNLYVGMTRARYELQIVVRPFGGRQHRRSPAGLIRAALIGSRELAPDKVMYEAGDARWKQSVLVDSGETARAAEPDRGEIRWGASNDPLVAGSVAPSQLEGGSHINLGHTFSRERRDAMAFGRLIHAWFELIEWSDDSAVSEDRAIALALVQGIESGFAHQAFARFRAFVQGDATRGLLEKSRYEANVRSWLNGLGFEVAEAEVRCEQAIAHIDPATHSVISGAIDRLILFRSGGQVCAADIIDFKTDPCGASAEEQAAKGDFYAAQLSAYANAVAAMFQIPRDHIRTRLLMVNADAVIEVGPTAMV